MGLLKCYSYLVQYGHPGTVTEDEAECLLGWFAKVAPIGGWTNKFFIHNGKRVEAEKCRPFHEETYLSWRLKLNVIETFPLSVEIKLLYIRKNVWTCRKAFFTTWTTIWHCFKNGNISYVPSPLHTVLYGVDTSFWLWGINLLQTWNPFCLFSSYEKEGKIIVITSPSMM